MGVVSISNDDTNWTEIHHAEAGLGQEQTTAEPNAVDIDISAIADGKPTVYLQFHYKDKVTPGYFWMLDDITLYENPSIDGGVIAIDTPLTTCNIDSATIVTIRIKNF